MQQRQTKSHDAKAQRLGFNSGPPSYLHAIADSQDRFANLEYS